jgi:hypothetical protein
MDNGKNNLSKVPSLNRQWQKDNLYQRFNMWIVQW